MLLIIPARGGSKGVPEKNILPVGGIPLISRAIRSAKKSSKISRIIVSTDSQKIADLAKQEGAEVPFLRPHHLATDSARSIDVYLHACTEVCSNNELNNLSFVVILPTVPFRITDDIDNAIDLFKSMNADSVISVTEAPCPIGWYHHLTENKRINNVVSGFDLQSNRQEFDTCVVPNGAVYVFRYSLLERTRLFFNENTYGYFMPRERSVDIDEPIDFEFANYLSFKRKL